MYRTRFKRQLHACECVRVCIRHVKERDPQIKNDRRRKMHRTDNELKARARDDDDLYKGLPPQSDLLSSLQTQGRIRDTTIHLRYFNIFVYLKTYTVIFHDFMQN